MTQAEAAKALGISPKTLRNILNGRRQVTAKLALVIGRVFDTAPEMWVRLQASHDLYVAQIQEQSTDSSRMLPPAPQPQSPITSPTAVSPPAATVAPRSN